MNIIILIIAGITAYVFTKLYDIFFNFYCKYQEQKEIKKRLSNDLYSFQLRQLYLYAKSYFLAYGFNDAQQQALNYIISVDKSGLTNEKYRLIKNERSKRKCII